MNKQPFKIKKLIRNFKHILKIEKEIDIYLKYGNKEVLKKLKKNNLNYGKMLRIKKNITEVKRVIYEETKKLDCYGAKLCRLFCLDGKSVTAISMEYYTGITTIYRELNKLELYLYVIYLKSKKFEKSVNYLINQLQNIL